MHLHILGIGGTFMAGVARLAVELGHRVTGSDRALYPPMSLQLEALGVEVRQDYDVDCLDPAPDLVVVGNALGRGNAAVEAMLSRGLPYVSGPEWIEREVLPGRHVIAIAGTHGKTTVSSLVAWMLEHAGLAPGFLIGGLVENFGVSARLGEGECFVIEADEYDTAFFDKRSKFVHYHPRTLVVNNLEFDHADIFPDLAAIETQFHHLVRTLPREAAIIRPQPDAAIDALLARGCWSNVVAVARAAPADWRFDWHDGPTRDIHLRGPDGSEASAALPLRGLHNAWNVAMAAAAAATAGVAPPQALAALEGFANVKRRLELRGTASGVAVYDDFAHHPTAIAATIAALRGSITGGRIIAVLEPRSNTMRLGIHRDTLGSALAGADRAAILVPPDLDWDIQAALAAYPQVSLYDDCAALIAATVAEVRPDDHVLVMSNGAFEDIHNRLLAELAA
ncbi:MAG: UDP-N-acetylmuramate:L-alanyl-gamma-D-glutamyl-meso-diaminopimelate ligase [Gammaproteobacteria bacterium]|nr:UDP-N-acetylmuramate:L-alanyl-gamma-D-glutamyl-meso-diaminopimelate ligase [Gammaproteobacteria bacterium]